MCNSTHPHIHAHLVTHSRTHAHAHVQKRTQKAKWSFYSATVNVPPNHIVQWGHSGLAGHFKKPQISQKCVRESKPKKRGRGKEGGKKIVWTNKNKTCSCVKTNLMSKWSPSGNYPESLQVKVKSRHKCPKNVAAPFLISVVLLTFDLSPLYFLLHHLALFSASALLDNTPSIWRWRTTHVHSKTTSIRERIVRYLLWVQNT